MTASSPLIGQNLVLVIGDGMSLSTVAGGRVYKGQRRGRDGASTTLSWDRFPHVGNTNVGEHRGDISSKYLYRRHNPTTLQKNLHLNQKGVMNQLLTSI